MRLFKGIGATIMFGCACAGCSSSNTQADQTTSTESTTTPAPPSPAELATRERPPDQVKLDALYQAVSSADGSGNAINDKTNFMKAYTAYCKQLQNTRFAKDWTAYVASIDKSYPDYGVTKPSITLKTIGGLKITQDLSEGTQLYKEVTAIKEGDYVKFSMNVTHISDGAPYNECHDPDYDSPRGPLVSQGPDGEITSIAPIS